MLAVVSAILALSGAACPLRFHLYPSNTQGSVVIGWATEYAESGPSVCIVGGQRFPATTNAWKADTFHAVSYTSVITGLREGQKFTYSCGTASCMKGYSSTYHYTTPYTWAVYGDLGYANNHAVTQLTADMQSGAIDAIIHAGDFAYDLHYDGGVLGDEFENLMEPLYAALPTPVVPGNHEEYLNFSHYRGRFAAAAAIGTSGTPLWWSFDQGFVHFIGFSTELFAYYPDPTEQANMIAFIQADLAAANANRAAVPWVIAIAHKASWMDKTNFTVLGPLLESAGVDVMFIGHQHNYDRCLPFDPTEYMDGEPRSAAAVLGPRLAAFRAAAAAGVPAGATPYVDPQMVKEGRGRVRGADAPSVYTNPTSLVQIVVGSPGCPEGISTIWGPNPAVEIEAYGYGYLNVPSATTLKWQWTQTAANATAAARGGMANVQDTLTITQQHHGPRN